MAVRRRIEDGPPGWVLSRGLSAELNDKLKSSNDKLENRHKVKVIRHKFCCVAGRRSLIIEHGSS